MLDDVVDALVCPHCGTELTLAAGNLRCAHGHSFDVARQGYVSLVPGSGGGDTAAMVAARAGFLAAGHYAPIAAQVASDVARYGSVTGHVVDLGAGTGHYLGAVLARLPGHTGLALDVSKYACRRAAKAHPRMGAVVADVWRQVPVRSAAAAAVLNVFAPRNAAEMDRILRPDGALIVVTPNQDHLGALVSALGLLQVDEHKQDRLGEQLGGRFSLVTRTVRDFSMSLAHNDIRTVVSMGPSAWHANGAELTAGISTLPEPFEVTASVSVSVYRRM